MQNKIELNWINYKAKLSLWTLEIYHQNRAAIRGGPSGVGRMPTGSSETAVTPAQETTEITTPVVCVLCFCPVPFVPSLFCNILYNIFQFSIQSHFCTSKETAGMLIRPCLHHQGSWIHNTVQIGFVWWIFCFSTFPNIAIHITTLWIQAALH